MFRSSALVTLLSLTASAAGFLVQLMLARRYGISVDVDAYLFAISLPTFIAAMVSTMLGYELVPRIIACERDETYKKHYITSILIGVMGLSLLLGLIGGVIGMLQRQALPIDSPIRVYENLPNLIFLAWAICFSQIVLACVTTILNAHRRYFVGSLLALPPYLGMIILLLVLGDTTGISALPLGTLSGTIVGILIGIFLLRHHLFPMPFKHLLLPEMRELMNSSPYSAVALTSFFAYVPVDAYWAPQAGSGVLATLGYAQRLITAIGNIAVAGPSAVLVPIIAELIRDNNYKELKRLLLRSLLVIGGIAIGLAITVTVYAREIVHLLFGHGVIGVKEINTIANTIQGMAPGMVAMLISVIALRAFFCLRGVEKTAGVLGLGWVAMYFTISMITYKHGAYGLATGYTVTWVIYFCVLAHQLAKRTSSAR